MTSATRPDHCGTVLRRVVVAMALGSTVRCTPPPPAIEAVATPPPAPPPAPVTGPSIAEDPGLAYVECSATSRTGRTFTVQGSARANAELVARDSCLRTTAAGPCLPKCRDLVDPTVLSTTPKTLCSTFWLGRLFEAGDVYGETAQQAVVAACRQHFSAADCARRLKCKSPTDG